MPKHKRTCLKLDTHENKLTKNSPNIIFADPSTVLYTESIYFFFCNFCSVVFSAILDEIDHHLHKQTSCGELKASAEISC